MTAETATIRPFHPSRLHYDYDVYLGICRCVRICNFKAERVVLILYSFFVTAFVNGGGVSMIYGYILAFVGALATCAS